MKKMDHFAELEGQVCSKFPVILLCEVGNVQSVQEKGGHSKAPNETNEGWRGERRLAGRRNEGEVR